MSRRTKVKAPAKKAKGTAAIEVATLATIETTKKPLPVYLTSPDEPMERGIARTLLRPSINHAATLAKALRRDYGERGIAELAEELSEQCKAVMDGKMGRSEAILAAQSVTLDALFNDLARLAYCNWFTNLDAAERLMKIALRAQSQSRATLETLAEIKNPPVVIAKQANIAHGPQQVNNSFATNTHAHAQAREIQSEPSKLLEQTHGERLDTGTAGEAIGGDPAMATVGEIDRAEDDRG